MSIDPDDPHEDMEEVYIIEQKHNLEQSRKDVDQNGEPYNILEQVDDYTVVSEWAIAYAMAKYNEGDSVPAQDFELDLQVAVLQQYMDRMVELGYMEAIFQPNNEIGYRMTPKGRAWAKKKFAE